MPDRPVKTTLKLTEMPCVYCGLRAETRDHIVPKKLAPNGIGPHNIVPACRACNTLKGSMTPGALWQLALDVRAYADRIEAMAQTVERLLDERGLAGVLGHA